jgi:hypothetical protein
MSAYMPLIKLTQRRKDAKVLRLFYYGRTTGHDIIQRAGQAADVCQERCESLRVGL